MHSLGGIELNHEIWKRERHLDRLSGGHPGRKVHVDCSNLLIGRGMDPGGVVLLTDADDADGAFDPVRIERD